MKRALLSTISAALLAAWAQLATPAFAQRVFVAAQGSDANPCSFALPCRTFQHAHDVAAAGGEIDVLDPAGYGALTISKAISIQGHGFAGISAPGGRSGITINAAATDAVSLNGLLIEGSRAGQAGITFNSGRSLVVESCVVRNMVRTGLEFLSSATTLQTLAVSNSYFNDNGVSGIGIGTRSSGAITAAIGGTELSGNAVTGLDVDGTGGTGPLSVAVADSVAEINDSRGFLVESATGHSASSLTLTRTTASGNGVGVQANGPNATLRLAQSTVAGNGTGYFVSTGTIFSYGDNALEDNGSNSGTLAAATRR
jgi:hypothetical protein